MTSYQYDAVKESDNISKTDSICITLLSEVYGSPWFSFHHQWYACPWLIFKAQSKPSGKGRTICKHSSSGTLCLGSIQRKMSISHIFFLKNTASFAAFLFLGFHKEQGKETCTCCYVRRKPWPKSWTASYSFQGFSWELHEISFPLLMGSLENQNTR